MKPDDILGAIREAYATTRIQYRDGCLRVGRLVRDYLASVVCGKEESPMDGRFTKRSMAVLKVAETIGCTRNKVYTMLYAAMAADLLGDGNVGKMSQTMLFCFSPLLHWKPKSNEVWEIVPECVSRARALFQECVEKLPATHDEIRMRVKELLRSSGVKMRRGSYARVLAKARKRTVDHRTLAKASPGDVAELCLTMVLASADPSATAQKLIGDLAKVGKGRDNELRVLYDNAVTEVIKGEAGGETKDESIKKVLKHMTVDERASALVGLCHKIKRDKLKVG